MLELPPIPKLGYEIVWDCANCDQSEPMPIIGKSKNATNEDGSICHTIKLKCPNCGYINGEYRAIFYNLYEKGVIV